MSSVSLYKSWTNVIMFLFRFFYLTFLLYYNEDFHTGDGFKVFIVLAVLVATIDPILKKCNSSYISSNIGDG